MRACLLFIDKIVPLNAKCFARVDSGQNREEVRIL